MTNDPNEQPSDGPADRPNGSIDDDSVHPLTDPDDPANGEPAVPVGNAATDNEEDLGKDARLMGPAGN